MSRSGERRARRREYASAFHAGKGLRHLRVDRARVPSADMRLVSVASVCAVGVAVVVVASSSSCATVGQELERGHVFAACEKQYDDANGTELLKAWLEQHWHVDVR